MHAVLLALLALGLQASPTLITGVVRDTTGLPIAGATVEAGSALLAVSDDNGAFEISLPAGSKTLIRVSLPGFEPYESTLDARPDTRLQITLTLGRFEERVAVAAAAPAPVAEPTFEVQQLQVYRTPSAQGDLFRALQALPGVAAPDDSAGLFVRGGDVSEVLVALDDNVIAHPYRYETPTGGFRGAVDPFFITGATFTTGGFSARHGNALSAVVDMHGLNQPQAREVSGSFGLAGASASVAVPAGSRFGVRGAVNRTFTSLLFAVNGSPRRFEPPPEGWDGSAGFGWNLGAAGRIKGFFLRQHDQVGVEVEQDAFVGLLRSTSTHNFFGSHWDGAVGRWIATASLGADSYTRGTAAGVLDLDVTDRVTSWRVELAPPAVGRTAMRVGANGAISRMLMGGLVPTRGGDLAGAGGDERFDVNVQDWFGGTFIDSTTTLGTVAITAGARVDRFARSEAATVDPRLNLRFGLGSASALRFATGLYHQAPAPMYYDRVRGASSLSPMRAVHYVAGYESGRETEGLFIRTEAYLKKYTRLPLESQERGYLSDGYGSAHGLDLFAQWLSGGVELRANASWLDATRRWTPANQRNRYELPDGTWPADFEVPWSVQLIANVPLRPNTGIGISWRSAAGRPHTPIVGGRRLPEGILPVFGRINSERFPRYERLDVSANWLVPAGNSLVVLFASINNVLARQNFFEYAYSPDYSARRPVTSAAPRSVFVGMTFRRTS